MNMYDILYITGWWCYLTILKNDGVTVNGKDDIPYIKWKIKVMLETTNQISTSIAISDAEIAIDQCP